MYGGAKHDFEKEDKKTRDAKLVPGPKKPDDKTESDEEDEPMMHSVPDYDVSHSNHHL